MPSDPEAILDALAGGMSIRMAAKQFDVPEAGVREMLRDEVERCRDGERLREVWALADRRLAAVELKFFNKALEGDGDPQSAIVFVKTNERRSTLNGANNPQSHVLQVISQPPEHAQTATDQLEAAIDRIRAERDKRQLDFRDDPETSTKPH
jgi:hypothetical protein